MFFWKKSEPAITPKEVSALPSPGMMDPLPDDPVHARRSYSQSGEDMLAAYVAHTLRLNNIRYLDIGAYSPTHLSNTYFFYERGSNGVCVEANPDLAKVYKKCRPRDEVLNIAISPKWDGMAPFYIFNTPTLSTLSEVEANRMVKEEGEELVSTIPLEVRSVAKLLETQFPDRKLNFLSLDVEGLDYQIMQEFDFSIVKPEILCLETLEYKKSGFQQKNRGLIELMVANGYMVYADTFINTIFVDKAKWASR
jgi:FkbM family methyltransferase